MADVHSKETRSYNMSQIKGKNTMPELIVRRYLHSQGYRFRIHDIKLPGKPDIVLPKYKTVIQIHGCFWHGHENCRYFVLPKTRTEWWKKKISNTVERDRNNCRLLMENGWKVVQIFECELKTDRFNTTMKNLIMKIDEIY